jgi:hypothetical protein
MKFTITAVVLVAVLVGDARCQTTLAEHESRDASVMIVRHEKGTHGYDYNLRQRSPALPDSTAITILIQFKPLYSLTLLAIKSALSQGSVAEFGIERGDTSHVMSSRQIDKITRIQAAGLLTGADEVMWLSVQVWAEDLPPYTISIVQIRELEDYFNRAWRDNVQRESRHFGQPAVSPAPTPPSAIEAKPSSNVESRRSYSVQCSATTKRGYQCKRMTRSSNGLCWQHGGN